MSFMPKTVESSLIEAVQLNIDLQDEIQSLQEQLAESQKECEEQARLNGMGSEREAKLLGEIERLRRENEGLISEVEDLHEESNIWPEWAETILKIVRKYTGYDGYDGYDDWDGVDLPMELDEALGYYESEIERLKNANQLLGQDRVRIQAEANKYAEELYYERCTLKNAHIQLSKIVEQETKAWMLKTGHGVVVSVIKPICEIDYWQPLISKPNITL